MGKYQDEIILDVLKSKKNEGVQMLFEQYYLVLVVYAEQLLKDRGQSEDLVQDFFVRLWSQDYLGNVDAKDLRSYLFRSVRNSALTLLKKKDALTTTIDLLELQISEDNGKPYSDERVEQVFKEIANLPDRTRLAVEKVMLERKKYQEAATEMSVTVNTVKYLLKEGMKKLRKNLF